MNGMSGQRQSSFWRGFLLVLIPIVLLGAGLVLFFMGPLSQTTAHPYQVERFSGPVELYSSQTKTWEKVLFKTYHDVVFHRGDRIRTGKGADIDLKIPGLVNLRIKPESELEVTTKQNDSTLGLKLVRGSILGMTRDEFKDLELAVETSRLRASFRKALFLVEGSEKAWSSVGVLEGSAEVRPFGSEEPLAVKELESIMFTENERELPMPKRLTYQEWRALNEVRDLVFATKKEIEEQYDMRKDAGTLFRHVIDEGTFFTPNSGYANRKFYKDELGTVTLRIDYDVYPQNSFSGLYLKTRDLDLSKFKRLSFQLKSDPARPAPAVIRIEVKENLTTVRGFAVKPITNEWRLYSFDFMAQKATPVSEIVFVIENTRVGAFNTKGAVYLKDISIEPIASNG